MPNLGTIPASIASDTTDPAETADRGAAGFEDTLPCAPQLNPSLHAPNGTQAQHNTSGPGRRSETHEASPDSVRHRCLNILLALANPRCARALAALQHHAGNSRPSLRSGLNNSGDKREGAGGRKEGQPDRLDTGQREGRACGYGSRPVTLSRRPGGRRKGHSMPASILPPPSP